LALSLAQRIKTCGAATETAFTTHLERRSDNDNAKT
jgi:hypothetical protein